MVCSRHEEESIYLGVLVGKGLYITLEDSSSKAIKGGLLFIEGIRKKNLFYLHSSIVVSGIAVVSHMLSISNSSLLRQIRLGHAKEGVLQTLLKQGC